MKNIAIIGAGSFGTALAVVLTRAGNKVTIWAREERIVRSINILHANAGYLTDINLDPSITAFHNMEKGLADCNVVVFATPSHAIRAVAEKVKPHLSGNELIVNVAKGIENRTNMRMSEVLAEVLSPAIPDGQIGVLSGPSHAEEVCRFEPTTVVASSVSKNTALDIQEIFMTPMFRVYVNEDLTGVEIGGAVKNIMAIAAGVADGFELGDNAKAALMTRGLHEIKRMALALGGREQTLSGLSGMGDLIVTCTSQHSRNRNLGYRIGRGETLQEIESSMNMVAEGVRTTRAVKQWAEELNIEMPITFAVHEVLFENKNPKDMLYELMTRHPKKEFNI